MGEEADADWESGLVEWGIEDTRQKMADAVLDRRVPYPSPESIIADIIAKSQGHEQTTGAARRMAHKATRALRDAGWRILRS